MKHIHFDSIDSTQTYLKDHLITLENEESNILISCDKQFSGIGRTGNSWIKFEKSLAISFTFKPNNILTLSTIELGLIAINFLNINFNFNAKIKWPNDLYTDQFEKVGGIITNFANENLLIGGIGINFGEIEQLPDLIDYKYSSVPLSENISNQKLASNFYEFILKNRITSHEITSKFNENCIHLNKTIQIKSGENLIEGKFLGINSTGEAIILKGGEKIYINSGHLKIIE